MDMYRPHILNNTRINTTAVTGLMNLRMLCVWYRPLHMLSVDNVLHDVNLYFITTVAV